MDAIYMLLVLVTCRLCRRQLVVRSSFNLWINCHEHLNDAFPSYVCVVRVAVKFGVFGKQEVLTARSDLTMSECRVKSFKPHVRQLNRPRAEPDVRAFVSWRQRRWRHCTESSKTSCYGCTVIRAAFTSRASTTSGLSLDMTKSRNENERTNFTAMSLDVRVSPESQRPVYDKSDTGSVDVSASSLCLFVDSRLDDAIGVALVEFDVTRKTEIERRVLGGDAAVPRCGCGSEVAMQKSPCRSRRRPSRQIGILEDFGMHSSTLASICSALQSAPRWRQSWIGVQCAGRQPCSHGQARLARGTCWRYARRSEGRIYAAPSGRRFAGSLDQQASCSNKTATAAKVK